MTANKRIVLNMVATYGRAFTSAASTSFQSRDAIHTPCGLDVMAASWGWKVKK